MNYGELISDAFRISWRNKFLWFFGFFVAGTGGGSSNIPSNFGVSGGGGGDFGNPKNFPENSLQMGRALAQGSPFGPSGPLQDLSGNFILIAVLAVVVALLLALVFVVLSIISNGGLAESVAAIQRGEVRRFGTTWQAGLSNFWRVLGLVIVLFLISLGLLIATLIVPGLMVGAVFLLTQSVGWRVTVGILAGLLALVLTLLVFLPYWIIGKFALRELVVDRERIIASIGEGYGMFRRNLGRSLLIGLILIGLSIGITIALLIAFVILALVLAVPSVLLFIGGYTTAGVIAAIIAFVLFVIPTFVVSGAVGTFYHSYWTLAYLRLNEPPTPQPTLGTEPSPGVG